MKRLVKVLRFLNQLSKNDALREKRRKRLASDWKNRTDEVMMMMMMMMQIQSLFVEMLMK